MTKSRITDTAALNTYVVAFRREPGFAQCLAQDLDEAAAIFAGRMARGDYATKIVDAQTIQEAL
jgi:hypothetical protein